MNILNVIDNKYRFLTLFDPSVGAYWRSSIHGTDDDPFMASFPHLIDVGVMGHCRHGLSGKCILSGVECYQNGPNISKPNMRIEDFKRLAEECEGKTFQFALGGRGDVDEHESFEELLAICVEHQIVPNFTTSGYSMTPEKAKICKRYCGAVAVSWYGKDYTLNAVQMLLNEGVRTNIHYVLSNSSIDEAIQRIEHKDFPQGINGVIFLLHKPVGLGTKNNMLKDDDPRVRQFLQLAVGTEWATKIGFDSCIMPAFVSRNLNIDYTQTETCEGARFSCYISSDMKMTPCSFDQQEHWAFDLRDKTIKQAWNSKSFERFRDTFRNACPNCSERAKCMGGCPIANEIVLCEKQEKTADYQEV